MLKGMYDYLPLQSPASLNENVVSYALRQRTLLCQSGWEKKLPTGN